MKKQMSEKKKIVRVALLWCVCLAVGFGAGWLIAIVTRNGSWDPAAYVVSAAPALCLALTAVYVLLNLGVQTWGWATLNKCAKQARALTPDDEDSLETLEEKLGYPMVAASVMQVVNMAFFPVIMRLTLEESVPKATSDIVFAVTVAVFLLAMVAGFALSKKSVDVEKQLNPEKRGSLLDTSFQKTWEASCDEAQKRMIYEGGYRAFQAGSKTCSTLWLIGVLSQFLLGTGVLPILMVCAIWLVLQVSYFTATHRLEFGKR